MDILPETQFINADNNLLTLNQGILNSNIQRDNSSTQRDNSNISLNDNSIDSLEMHVYLADQSYFSVYNLTDWKITDNNLLETNTIKHLNEVDIYSGKYTIIYNGYKNLTPEKIGITIITEILNDRTQIKIKSDFNQNTGSNNTNIFFNAILQNASNSIDKLYINCFNNILIKAIPNPNKNSDGTLTFTLKSQLPNDIEIDNQVYLITPLFESVKFNISLFQESIPQEVNILNQPNWLAAKSSNSKKESAFYNWDTLLAYNPTSSVQLINHYLSGSLTGMNLNIDFSEYSNFIFYSSATERLKNFKYKLELIESYTNTVNSLDTQISNSSTIDTIVLANNLLKYQQKLNNIFGTFDEYEKYLYYDSSSAAVESPTWPKLNNTKPYQLYSTTSSYISDIWYNAQLYSASLYDTSNVNSLINVIPEHIYEDELNSGYITFIQMVSHHYDILWLYIKSLTKLSDRQESINKGMPKDLIYHVLQSFGWDPSFGNQFNDLWINAYGDNTKTINEPYLNLNPISTEDITKQIWKRILNNLPYLLKNSGTIEGIKALINCYGIPETMLPVKEYGGPNKVNNVSTIQHQNYGYSWKVIPSSKYYFDFDLLYPVSQDKRPVSFEIRFKTENAENTYSLQNSNKILFTCSSGSLSTLFVSLNHKRDIYGNIIMHHYNGIDYDNYIIENIPIYNGDWNTIVLTATADSTSFYLKQTDGQNITYQYTESYSNNITESLKYTSIQIPGSIYLTGSTSYNIYDYEVQEFKYWTSSFTDELVNIHTLNPIAYNGLTETSSYTDLLIRLPFGAEGNIPNDLIYTYTSSAEISIFTQSFHPNQKIINTSFTQLPDSMSLLPYELTYTMQYPDISTNRSISNKIRIESNNAFNQNILDLNKRTEISNYDTYPLDSPKIGVYFSPVNEINKDIANQFGGFNIDNYIGDYSQNYDIEYPDLININSEYFKKYNKKYNFNEYLNLLKFYDYSLFNQIKKMIPARSKGLIGHVIEPHILNRSKIKLYDKPNSENLAIESVLESENYKTNQIIADTHSLDVNLVYDYSFISSSVLDTIITGSTRSSFLQKYYLTITSSQWISGSEYIETNLSTALTDIGHWNNSINSISYIPNSYATFSVHSSESVSKIISFKHTQSMNCSGIDTIIGVELKFNEFYLGSGSVFENYIKIGNQYITDILPGDNKYRSGSVLPDTDTEIIFGSPSDTWNQNIIKTNSIYSGIGMLGIDNSYLTQSWNVVANTKLDQKDVNCLIEYKSKIYAGTSPSGSLFLYNGNDWELVVPQSGSETDIKSLCVYGTLFAGTGNFGLLYKWDITENQWILAADTLAETSINCLCVYNNIIYGGTSPNGCLYEFSGTGWKNVADKFEDQTDIKCLIVFDSELYAGTSPDSRFFKWTGTEWNTIINSYGGETSINSFIIFNGELYACTSPSGYLLKFNSNNISWTEMANSINISITKLLEYNGRLYGSTNPSGSLYEWNGENKWNLILHQSDSEYSINDMIVSSNNTILGCTSPNGKLLEWQSTPTNAYLASPYIKLHYTLKNLYPAEVSDFEPTGLINLKYNGCKISSSNFNQPSVDTPDGGAVAEYRIINPDEIIVESSISNNITQF